ncbi:MAG: permease prefix domain 1-containing protein [Bacillaceae bacterium]
MKQIDMFVESVYQNIDGNKEEIHELKKEMKAHLIESVYELKAEGRTEEEAIEIAIQRFGGEKITRSIIGELFEKQKRFASWLLYVGITCLILSLVTYIYLSSHDKNVIKEVLKIDSEILSVLNKYNGITKESKEELDTITNSNSEINYVLIYDMKEISTEKKNYTEINYRKAHPIYEGHGNLRSISNDVDIYHGSDNSQWAINTYYYEYSSLKMNILFAGIAIYWLFFAIWAIIRVSDQKRLSISWVFSFLLFNVLGYFIYILAPKKSA